MADLMLPRGKEKILKAEDKDYDRGLLVKLLDNGGYSKASLAQVNTSVVRKFVAVRGWQ